MFFRPFLIVFIVLGLVSNSIPQTVGATDDAAKKLEELRKDAVVFLRETSAEVSTLRSIENRISLSSEMAGLMWLYDDKEASAMYRTVIADFNQLLTDYDSQITAMQIVPSEREYRGGFMGGGDESEKGKLTQRFYKAMGVRKTIALGMAEHDAELAYDFYVGSLSLITNPELRKNFEGGENYFDSTLMRKMAEQNAAKALEFGRRSIKGSIGWVQYDMLRSLYQKDNEKGAEFAADVVRAIKAQKEQESRLQGLATVLRMGVENDGKAAPKTTSTPTPNGATTANVNSKKVPMFAPDALRDLADAFAKEVLEIKDVDMNVDVYASLVEQVLPARAVQIRAKFPPRRESRPRPNAANMEAPVVRTGPYGANVAVAANSEKPSLTPEQKERQELESNLEKLGQKELPKEERDKIVEQARKVIGGLGSRTEKITSLSAIAAQVKNVDKPLAAEVLRDAIALVNPQPRNYRDYLEMWMVMSALSDVEPDKAFPMLEEGIYRLNDTLSAFIKVGEFIDVSGEMIDDGEVQVGGFGGEMVSGLTRELGVATPTIKNLATADFARTKALTTKFDRPEIRILAKMLVLRAVLDKGKTEESEDARQVIPGLDGN